MMLFWLHWTRFVAFSEVLWVVMITVMSLEISAYSDKIVQQSPQQQNDGSKEGRLFVEKTVDTVKEEKEEKNNGGGIEGRPSHHINGRDLGVPGNTGSSEEESPEDVPLGDYEERNLTDATLDEGLGNRRSNEGRKVVNINNNDHETGNHILHGNSMQSKSIPDRGPILNSSNSSRSNGESQNIDPLSQGETVEEEKPSRLLEERGAAGADGLGEEGEEKNADGEAKEPVECTNSEGRKSKALIGVGIPTSVKCDGHDSRIADDKVSSRNEDDNAEHLAGSVVVNNRTVGSGTPAALASKSDSRSLSGLRPEQTFNGVSSEESHSENPVNHQNIDDRTSSGPIKTKIKSLLETKTFMKNVSNGPLSSKNVEKVKKKQPGTDENKSSGEEQNSKLDSGTSGEIASSKESSLLMSDQPHHPASSSSFASVDDSPELVQDDNDSSIASMLPPLSAVVNATVVETSGDSPGTGSGVAAAGPPNGGGAGEALEGHTMKAIDTSNDPAQSQFGGFDVAIIIGIALTVLIISSLIGAASFVLYRHRYWNKPQTLSDKCSNADSSGYIDDSTLRENSEEMYSLDNDWFLNSLEAMTIQNYWTDNVKHTKL